MTTPATSGSAVHAPSPGLSPGATLGDRYEVLLPLPETLFGEAYQGIDRKADTAVVIRVFHPDLMSAPGALDRLRSLVKVATRVSHKNVVRTIDLMSGPRGPAMITEWTMGSTTLRDYIAARHRAKLPVSLKTAYNVVAHLANALTAIHAHGFHGALTADGIVVNDAGRLRISDLGLGLAFPGFVARAARQRPAALVSIAPEVVKGQAVDKSADFYSVGVILYELLTGRSPSASAGRLSTAVPGLPAEIDQFVARCVSPDPKQRFADAAAMKGAMAQLLASGRAQTSSNPALPRPGTPIPGPAMKKSGGASFDESEERWLVTKARLDFGPYSFTQVREQVEADQIVPGNVLLDNETGTRTPVEEHPLLRDAVLAAAQRRDDMRRANAEEAVVKQDKRRGAALYVFLAAGALVLAGGAWLVVRGLSSGGSSGATGELSALETEELKGLKLGLAKEDPARPKRRGGGSRTRGAAETGGGLDFNSEGGDDILDEGQINGVIGRHGSSLGSCLLAEKRRGGATSASIEFAIAGTGKVIGGTVKVNGDGGSALTECVRKRMTAMQFPTFGGARTRSSFDMSL